MKTKMICCCIVCFSVFCSHALADCETPEEKTYTYVRARWSGTEVFSGRSALGSIGYTKENEDITADGMESGILWQIANECDDFGGLLLVEAHGLVDQYANYYLAMEVFPFTTQGYNGAVSRATSLMSGALYASDDLQVAFVAQENGWGVCLTEQGIGNAFSGSNGLFILAACYGSNAFSCGVGGTRQMISWSTNVQSSTAQTEVNTLFSRLTEGAPAFMSTQTATNGTMTYAGGWMALVPIILRQKVNVNQRVVGGHRDGRFSCQGNRC